MYERNITILSCPVSVSAYVMRVRSHTNACMQVFVRMYACMTLVDTLTAQDKKVMLRSCTGSEWMAQKTNDEIRRANEKRFPFNDFSFSLFILYFLVFNFVHKKYTWDSGLSLSLWHSCGNKRHPTRIVFIIFANFCLHLPHTPYSIFPFQNVYISNFVESLHQLFAYN